MEWKQTFWWWSDTVVFPSHSIPNPTQLNEHQRMQEKHLNDCIYITLAYEKLTLAPDHINILQFTHCILHSTFFQSPKVVTDTTVVFLVCVNLFLKT